MPMMRGSTPAEALAITRTSGFTPAFSPTPSDLAAIQFDRSGTTRIGKYVINHSFICPGLIGVSTSCIVGYLPVSATKLI